MFINQAFAQGTAPVTEPSLMMSYLPLFLVIAIIYFLVIRPQNQRARAHTAMVSALNKGDRVMTTGGIHGDIVKVHDDLVDVEIAKDVVITMNRHSVAAVVKEGKASQKAKNQKAA